MDKKNSPIPFFLPAFLHFAFQMGQSANYNDTISKLC